MEFMTTEKVADATGLPYRQILGWVEHGWYEPRIFDRGPRNVMMFDQTDVWRLSVFSYIRHRFQPSEWREVLCALTSIERPQTGRRFVAALRGGAYRTVSESEVPTLARRDDLLMLVALEPEGTKKKS